MSFAVAISGLEPQGLLKIADFSWSSEGLVSHDCADGGETYVGFPGSEDRNVGGRERGSCSAAVPTGCCGRGLSGKHQLGSTGCERVR